MRGLNDEVCELIKVFFNDLIVFKFDKNLFIKSILYSFLVL